jgi:hypothetical protein
LALIPEMTGERASLRQTANWLCNRATAKWRLLVCDLAIRAYSLDHGRSPAKLADLVPDYLPEVPKDPFGNGEFVYRLTPTGHELHSAGTEVTTGKPIALDEPK